MIWGLGGCRIAFPANCLPGGEGLAEVAPVRVFTGHHQPLIFLDFFAERLALGG